MGTRYLYGTELWDWKRIMSIPWRFCILLSAYSFLVSAVNGTLEEGLALQTMMQKWKVDFPSWRNGGDPCQGSVSWEYVGCLNGQVISLNVSNTGLDGPLPEEVGQLTSLQVLDLGNCCADRTDKSRILNFVSNPGVGEIFPDSLAKCTQLRSLNVSNIAWGMPFPEVITKLPLLEEIYMPQTNLSGRIPDDFFKLSRLRSVYLGSIEGWVWLSGDLKGFAKLKELEYLSIYRNQFNSPIDEELGTLTKLVLFNCHTCNLYGGLPESFGRLPRLQNVTIHRNDLSGRIPDSWKNLTTITNMRIDQNYLFGEFPLWMMNNFTRLDSLYLSRNLFYGPVPYSISQFDAIYNISYKYNVLRWDCNYFNSAYTPCVSGQNPCSQIINSRYASGYGADYNNSFVFSPNCYGDALKEQRDAVQQCSKGGHALDCDSFYRQVVQVNQCPDCPLGQTYLHGPNDPSCVCTKGNGINIQEPIKSKFYYSRTNSWYFELSRDSLYFIIRFFI